MDKCKNDLVLPVRGRIRCGVIWEGTKHLCWKCSAPAVAADRPKMRELLDAVDDMVDRAAESMPPEEFAKLDIQGEKCPTCGMERRNSYLVSHGDVRNSINCTDTWHRPAPAAAQVEDRVQGEHSCDDPPHCHNGLCRMTGACQHPEFRAAPPASVDRGVKQDAKAAQQRISTLIMNLYESRLAQGFDGPSFAELVEILDPAAQVRDLNNLLDSYIERFRKSLVETASLRSELARVRVEVGRWQTRAERFSATHIKAESDLLRAREERDQLRQLLEEDSMLKSRTEGTK